MLEIDSNMLEMDSLYHQNVNSREISLFLRGKQIQILLFHVAAKIAFAKLSQPLATVWQKNRDIMPNLGEQQSLFRPQDPPSFLSFCPKIAIAGTVTVKQTYFPIAKELRTFTC